MGLKAQKEKEIKIDAITKKVLYYLGIDYRTPRNKLAKIISISPQRLNHRIKQLESQLIKPYICLNYPLLNIQAYLLLYESLDEGEVENISNSEKTYYLLRLAGKNQYLAIILADDILEFCSTATKNSTPQIFSLTKFIPDGWNGYGIGANSKTKKDKTKKYYLETEDYKILLFLSKKSTISKFELSKQLKMSVKTIKKRMKLMEESDIIQGYKFSINLPKIGFLTYIIHLTCRPDEVYKNINLIQSDNYAGFLFQSDNQLFFSYIVPESKYLFNFLERIEKETNSIVDLSQNTGDYLVEPVPKTVINYLENKSK